MKDFAKNFTKNAFMKLSLWLLRKFQKTRTIQQANRDGTRKNTRKYSNI